MVAKEIHFEISLGVKSPNLNILFKKAEQLVSKVN